MKINIFTKFEILTFGIVYSILIVNGILLNDSPISIISSLCGLTYTILAGKGIPICYPIGITGNGFYIYLTFLNNLWGNMLLTMFYYVPMEILGFIKWNKNLKKGKYEIIKTTLKQNELIISLSLTVILSIFIILLLIKTGDAHPYMDGLITVLSILAMYYTVKRVIEQWIIWTLVNAISFIMWLKIAINDGKVYTTAIMWFIYLILGIYFYIKWYKEINSEQH